MTTTMTQSACQGWWQAQENGKESGDLAQSLLHVNDPVFLLEGLKVAQGGSISFGGPAQGKKVLAFAPALHPSALGDQEFLGANPFAKALRNQEF